MRTDSAPPFAPYGVFLVVAAAMILVGGLLQVVLPLAFGLMLSEVLCILLPALVAQKMYPGTWQSLRPSLPQAMTPPAWVSTVLTAITVGLFANILAALVVHFNPALQERQAAYMEVMQGLLNPPEVWKAIAGIVSITVFAPICEEILFRGTMLKVQLRDQPLWRALVVNGLLFGLVHFNEMSLVPLSVVGAFFAWLTYRTGSVIPAILAHASLNGVNGVVLPRLVDPELLTTAPALSDLLTGLGIVSGLAAVGVFALNHMLPKPQSTP